MTYEKFIQEIPILLTKYLPEDTTLKVRPVLKNNNLVFEGLLITTPSVNISPTIYLNPYYELYQDGFTLSEICEMIAECYKDSKIDGSVDTSFFEDFSQVKEHIVCKLINVDLNRTLLKQVPYIAYLDLAIVFCYFIPGEKNELASEDVNATILIHHNHLKLWDITTDDLFHLAMENTPRIFPGRIVPMSQLLLELEEDVPCDTLEPPIYVLTNQLKFFGASVLLYRDILKKCSDLFKDDFYLIPSSIHEVIALPKELVSSRENLNALIQEVNREHVAPEEILSDHFYFYNYSTGQLQ